MFFQAYNSNITDNGGVFMTLKERFREVMEHFNPDICPPRWEFGYWGQTIDTWYDEGMPKNRYPEIPTETTTPSSPLYTPAGTQSEDRVFLQGSQYLEADYTTRHRVLLSIMM